MKNNFFTYSQKEQNHGQSEQLLLKRKCLPAGKAGKEKIVEDDRCMSNFDTDSTLNAALCPALCDLKKLCKTQVINIYHKLKILNSFKKIIFVD
ncbi:MAG: hypothetical protein PHR81_08740 [Bacteroidales bacterium]|jgi:hypothetical protein|nr:hypothetical protein [Bacteroidales bacterium]MDD4214882.1 hypothetical protein [Bacteroidales bacterium]